MDIIKTLLSGIVIGMANVIPGVSGGTLAVVFGIYEKFVNAITLNLKKLWENRRFVFPLLAGMACGVLIFSKAIEYLYEYFPLQTNYCFFGLILGSIPLLFGYVFKKSENEEKFSPLKIVSLVLCFALGFALIILFSVLESKFGAQEAIEMVMPELSVALTVRLLIAGFIGAIAMVVPGISGSLLMLIMGVYTIIITAIPAIFVPATTVHAILLLIPNGIGVVCGVLTGAKVISWLLKKWPNQVYAAIFGLICASAITAFPGIVEITSFGKGLGCFLCMAGGACLAFFTSRIKSN